MTRLLLLLGLCLLPLPRLHAQQVHRCVAAGGETVYSDRRCEDLGARDRLPPAPPRTGAAAPPAQVGCPRRLSDLVYRLRDAVQARDVNRLSGLYLWPALSDRGAGQVLSRLEAIVQRPLLDIAPVYPDADPDAPDAAAGTPRPRPRGLRLEQTLAGGSTPSRTVFELRRQYDCFWISF